MPLWLVVAVTMVAWPIGLGAALFDRVTPPASIGSDVVYLSASRVCHQRPDRSFHTAGQQWPVCARCAGLYLAAPVGVLLGLWRGRPGPANRATLAAVLALAALPTLLSWSAEALAGVAVSGTVRALAAAPLGCVMAMTVVLLMRPQRRLNQVD